MFLSSECCKDLVENQPKTPNWHEFLTWIHVYISKWGVCYIPLISIERDTYKYLAFKQKLSSLRLTKLLEIPRHPINLYFNSEQIIRKWRKANIEQIQYIKHPVVSYLNPSNLLYFSRHRGFLSAFWQTPEIRNALFWEEVEKAKFQPDAETHSISILCWNPVQCA